MPKLVNVNNNTFQKVNTEADYNRALGILRDVIVVVTLEQELSRIVPTTFKYTVGTNELEVYLDGNFLRVNETIDEIDYGDYAEYSNFSVMFNEGIISEGDAIRFRVTAANYRISDGSGSGGSSEDILTLDRNLTQLSIDVFGSEYSFNESTEGSIRTVGKFENYETIINLSRYRTWCTADIGATITNFTGCHQDDIRYIIFTNNTTTISNAGNIKLDKGLDVVGVKDEVITLIYQGGLWKEVRNSRQSRTYTKTIKQTDWGLDADFNLFAIDISSLNNKNIITTCYDNQTNERIEASQIILYDENYCYLRMPRIEIENMQIKFCASLADFSYNIIESDWTPLMGLYYCYVPITTLYFASNVIVSCYDNETNSKIIPYKLEIAGDHVFRLWMPEPKDIIFLCSEADYSNTIQTTDWIEDISTGNYYYDNDISGIDSTALVSTYFYDSDTLTAISPINVDTTSSDYLRIWMTDNTHNVDILVDSSDNLLTFLDVESFSPYMTYNYLLDEIPSTINDFVISAINTSTNRSLQFDGVRYDYEISNSFIRIWSNYKTGIKITVVG